MAQQDDRQRFDARERARAHYFALLSQARSPLLGQGEEVRDQLAGQFNAIFEAAWAINASEMVEILSLTIGHRRAASAIDPAASLAAANMIFAAALPVVTEEYLRRGVPNAPEAAAIRLNEAVLRRMAAAAQAYVATLARKAGGDPASRTSQGSAKVLTQKESTVLSAVAAGRSNREIADHLHLSEATVKRHLATIFRKLGIRNRLAAVAVGRSLGLLD